MQQTQKQDLYKAYCETVSGIRTFLPLDQKIPLKPGKDFYESLYHYTEANKKIAEELKTLSTIKGDSTNRLYFDFDNKDNLESAKKDTLDFCSKLIENGIPQESIKAYFSGMKGFNLDIELTERIPTKQFKDIVFELAGNIPTFDKSVNDPNRIIRVTNTKHPKTGLYKIPLELYELDELSIDDIKKLATSPRSFEQEKIAAVLPESFKAFKSEEKTKLALAPNPKALDLTNRPSNWKPWKWALLQGFFGDEPGERHNALLVLAATCRGMGYDKESTYYLCKSALKKQATRTGREEFEKEELWENIIDRTVFGENWKGGQYSPENNPWLQKYCENLGIDWKESTDNISTINETFEMFKGFAENIDSLTIRTGIDELDSRLRLTVGMSVGIVAAPGTGKTSLAIQMLNNMSKSGIHCAFFSYDMYHSLVFQKLVQRHFNIPSEEIFQRFKDKDQEFIERVKKRISEEYENVSFCFETGQTIEDIIKTIDEAEAKKGMPVKFVVCDYNELIVTDKSDPTQSSSYVAQKMREIANTTQRCVLSLFQPNKMAGSPSDEIRSYRSAKGSSAIEQSVSVMLGMSRPGFNPRTPQEDIFATIGCLKNRMGPIFSLDLGWDGLTGTVRNLDFEEKQLLKEIRDRSTQDSGASFV